MTGAPPSAGGHACKKRVGRPPRAGHPVTEQRSPSRGAPAARRTRWRKRHPLSSDLPRQTSAPIEGDGGVTRSLDLVADELDRGREQPGPMIRPVSAWTYSVIKMYLVFTGPVVTMPEESHP